MRHLIALTGGLGSGKSVVARMLVAMGYDVYDCDSRAREIMDHDVEMQRRIAVEICSEAVGPCGIDRRRLAEAVFSNSRLLEKLNSIVHGSVRADLRRWVSGRQLAFVETAILYESSLDREVDEVWVVDAPRDVRIMRGMKRDYASRESVEARIRSQESFDCGRVHANVRHIINDGTIAVLPQVLNLLSA